MQRLQYIQNIFRHEALRFNNGEVSEYNSYPEEEDKMRSHFNSTNNHQRVEAEMMTVSLKKFKDEANGLMQKGLPELALYNASQSQQCPPNFRDDAHEVGFMRMAGFEFKCSTK